MHKAMELPLDLEWYPDGTTVDLWVHLREGSPIVLKDVSSGALIQGFWLVEYRLLPGMGDRVTAFILDEKVQYFTVIVNESVEAS